MDWLIAFIALGTGYLVGAISFTRLLARVVAPDADFSRTQYFAEEGAQTFEVTSVNATSLALRTSPKIGMLVGLLDLAKVFGVTLAFRLLYPGQVYHLIAAAAGMVGHIWPVYHRFRGGRGISTVYGGMLAIDPVGAVVTAILGPIIGLLLRDAFTTFIGGMWLLIPWLALRTGDWRYVVYAVTVNVIFLLASIPEIRSYLKRKREGRMPSFDETMKSTPMGAGLYKLGVRLGVVKESSGDVTP